ncbi:hypothetical protein TNCV_607471 [Trichonephila clavipes]|nr:hypothetical protein TNCV_607471 [Trichonephila clavipes]
MEHVENPLAFFSCWCVCCYRRQNRKCIDPRKWGKCLLSVKDVILENEEGGYLLQKWKILHVKECLAPGFSWHDETVGMVRIFQRSFMSSVLVRYTSYIGDGDSKTFSSITASNPYGEDITVSKIECVGHVQKNGNSFTKIKTNELQTQ